MRHVATGVRKKDNESWKKSNNLWSVPTLNRIFYDISITTTASTTFQLKIE